MKALREVSGDEYDEVLLMAQKLFNGKAIRTMPEAVVLGRNARTLPLAQRLMFSTPMRPQHAPSSGIDVLSRGGSIFQTRRRKHFYVRASTAPNLAWSLIGVCRR